MGNKNLLTRAHTIDWHWWWFETEGGISVSHRIAISKNRGVMTNVIIPWRSIRAALKRKEKP